VDKVPHIPDTFSVINPPTKEDVDVYRSSPPLPEARGSAGSGGGKDWCPSLSEDMAAEHPKAPHTTTRKRRAPSQLSDTK